MNILVVSQYYYPEQFRINDICEELVRRGHNVTVLTGLPNYPEGEIFRGYEDSYKHSDLHNGVNIVRCRIKPRHKGSANLIKNYYSFARNGSKKIKELKNNFDVVYVYQMSPVSMIIPAQKYKKLFGAPIYVYCCDIWPESVREKSDGSLIGINNPVYLIAKLLSKKLYSKVDFIGVKCGYFSDYLHDVCKVDLNKTKVLYEHAEDIYLSVSERSLDNNCYDFMFLGNIGSAQNCDYLVKAAALLKTEKPYRLHFVGSGSDLEKLKKYVTDHNMNDRVVFHGRHPVSEINNFYEFADCCMLVLSAKTAIGLTPPAKLVGYMAASRPIIAAAEGATRDIIAEADCGICVSPENIESIADAMQFAIDHPTEFASKGINGRCFFRQHFTLEKHIDELEKQLSELMGE